MFETNPSINIETKNMTIDWSIKGSVPREINKYDEEVIKALFKITLVLVMEDVIIENIEMVKKITKKIVKFDAKSGENSSEKQYSKFW